MAQNLPELINSMNPQTKETANPRKLTKKEM